MRTNKIWIIAIVLVALLAFYSATKAKKDNAAELAQETSSAESIQDSKGEQTNESWGTESSEGDNATTGKGNTTSKTSSSTTKNKKSGNARLIELPATKKGETVISHTGYTLSFNTKYNNPNWVAWELTAEETNGTLGRSNNFSCDPDVPYRNQVSPYDYKNSGYDRGHMCPAADMKWSVDAMNQCFYMSNMCPQTKSLNTGSWKDLEEACRRWAQREGSIYIVCGPIYKSNRKTVTIGQEHTVTVPDAFFKCVLSLQSGKEKAIGFYYTNNDATQHMTETARSVDEIEALTGYDFFVNLDNKLEEKLESTCSFKSWQ